MKTRKVISNVSSYIFGYLCIALSIFVSIEVVLRKLFGRSLQGADELGGYALAITSTIAFCIALIGNNHIRIDIFHYRFSRMMQAILNWFAVISMVILAFLISMTSWQVLRETLEYGSTAPTPWATPLWIPQILWFSGTALFFFLSLIYFYKSTGLLLRGNWKQLREDYQPKSSSSEVEEELKDISNR